jgi:hypothetical protein
MEGIAMSDRTNLLRGIVRGGVVVFEPGVNLPEGAAVEVHVTESSVPQPTPFTPEEAAEFAGWERISDEAWAMIDWGEGEIARDAG